MPEVKEREYVQFEILGPMYANTFSRVPYFDEALPLARELAGLIPERDIAVHPIKRRGALQFPPVGRALFETGFRMKRGDVYVERRKSDQKIVDVLPETGKIFQIPASARIFYDNSWGRAVRDPSNGATGKALLEFLSEHTDELQKSGTKAIVYVVHEDYEGVPDLQVECYWNGEFTGMQRFAEMNLPVRNFQDLKPYFANFPIDYEQRKLDWKLNAQLSRMLEKDSTQLFQAQMRDLKVQCLVNEDAGKTSVRPSMLEIKQLMSRYEISSLSFYAPEGSLPNAMVKKFNDNGIQVQPVTQKALSLNMEPVFRKRAARAEIAEKAARRNGNGRRKSKR